MPSTRQRLVALHRQKPHLNQTELADALGVTRQRVEQLAKAEKLKLKKGPSGIGGRSKLEESAPAAGSVVPKGTTPAVAILLTAADLTRRGFTVYVPLMPTGKADLVAIDADDNVERIAVRRGKRTGKDVRYDDPDRGGSTRRALLLTDEPISYEPKLPGQSEFEYHPLHEKTLTGRGAMSLTDFNPLDNEE